jgi:hypothetical protein
MSYCRNSRDGRQPVQGGAGHAQGRDQLLGLPVGERAQGGEVRSRDVVGVLFSHFLDIDAAHVGEQHHRALADAVPHHAGVVLVGHGCPRVDQHATRHVAPDLQAEDMLGVVGGLLGRVGELNSAGLHPPA